MTKLRRWKRSSARECCPNDLAILEDRRDYYLWTHPTPRFSCDTPSSPKFLAELSRRVVLYAPPCSYAPNRFGHTMLASCRQKHWPHGCLVTRRYVEGSFTLRITFSSDRTPARQSPDARPAFLITFGFLCDSSSFHLDCPAKLRFAYPTPLRSINNYGERYCSNHFRLSLNVFLKQHNQR